MEKNNETVEVELDARLVDSDNSKNKVKIMAHQSEISSFSGPLPHPDTLKKYDEVLPGAAERILKMAENQQEHRHHLEKTLFLDDSVLRKRNSFYAFFLTLALIVSGALLLMYDKNISGMTALLSSLIPILVTIFNKNSDESVDESSDVDIEE